MTTYEHTKIMIARVVADEEHIWNRAGVSIVLHQELFKARCKERLVARGVIAALAQEEEATK